MASLRLTFPEKDQPTVIALTGARLTIGRLPFNTIQIIDRTVSGFHAELISEHGHYRLHDRGSSNGTYVNGQKVSDYHLNDACTISFGTVEAQFSPADIATADDAEIFPSRGEVNAVRQENAEMKATVAALREEIDALRKAPAASGEGEGAPAMVAHEEYQRVVVEREALKEAQLRQEEEINRLKTDLAIVKRDRLNLQLAYDAAQRETEQLRRKVSGADDEPALPPVEAAAVVAAQADTVRIELPKRPSVPAAPLITASTPVVVPPVPDETPSVPAAPEPTAPLASAASLPKPSFPIKIPAGGGHPPAPVVPGKAPAAPGVRPVVRPANAPAPANNGGPSRTTHRPLPPPRKIPQPIAKPNPQPEQKSGPKGTQKLTE
jgi:pSer/pThr/pTyr-binding forkhead associated (FHA) protein